eukprot:scaffold75883_cov76-Phaeocystis_antarctica.AAC.1
MQSIGASPCVMQAAAKVLSDWKQFAVTWMSCHRARARACPFYEADRSSLTDRGVSTTKTPQTKTGQLISEDQPADEDCCTHAEKYAPNAQFATRAHASVPARAATRAPPPAHAHPRRSLPKSLTTARVRRNARPTRRRAARR